ncbi:MAG: VOC family protein [Pseudomonadota bacterium]
MSVAVSYFEIPVADLNRAQQFYETVFAIELEPAVVDGYEMALFPVVESGPGASGALAKGDVYKPGKRGPVLYFTAVSIDTVLTRLARLDGLVLFAKKRVEGQGFVAEIEDNEGNRIGLFEPQT